MEGTNGVSREGAAHEVAVGRDNTGTIVAGSYNLVITDGSSVTLEARELPPPVRRDRVELLPGQRSTPVIGRAAILTELQITMRSDRVIQLWGAPGTGKSTILRHAARTFAPGPDGVVFVSAASDEAGDLAQAVFEACYENSGYAPRGAELRTLMAGIRITVYVDNADLSDDQLRELTDTIPDATFVFASREGTLQGEGRVIQVTGLDLAEGLQLLESQLPCPLSGPEQAAARDLWAKSGGQPLPLVRAAGLAERDESGSARLPRPGAVAELVPLLLDKMELPEAKALGLLTTLDGAELDAAHVGELVGEQDPAGLCRRLADLGLLLADEDKYRCSPDVLPVTRQRYTAFPADQLCQYFASWAARSATTPEQVAGHAAALAQAARLAQENGHPDLAVRLARAASPTMARALRFGLWGLLLGRGWSAARASGDKRAEAYFLREEGVRCVITGSRVLAAVLTVEALTMLKELGDIHSVEAALQAQSTAAGHGIAAGHGAAAGHGIAVGHGAAAGHGLAASSQATAPHSAIAAHNAAGALAKMSAHMTHLAHVEHLAHLAHLAHAATAQAASAGVAVPAVHTAAVHTAVHTGASVSAGTGTTGAATGTAVGAKVAVAAVALTAVVAGGAAVAANSGPSQPTGITGSWADSGGNGFTIVSSGGDTYTAEAPNCPALNFTVTGSDGTYTGRQPGFLNYTQGSCPDSPPAGYDTVTLTLSSDGQNLQMVTAMSPDEQGSYTCETCGTDTLTRANS